jgi:hypothetical protein
MPWELHHGQRETLRAVAALVPRSLVQLSPTVVDSCFAVGSGANRPFGLIDASVAAGYNVTVYGDDNIVKAIAAASFGQGAEVGIASLGVATKAQGASYLATVQQFGVAAGASGVVGWAVGIARSAGAVGEEFSLEIRIRETGGLA